MQITILNFLEIIAFSGLSMAILFTWIREAKLRRLLVRIPVKVNQDRR